ncbi:MAG TPA: hypothetical protein PLU05_04390 [Candidatus Cloacimonas acidaminovorans]|jgi:CRISPR-associated protein Csm4|nr:hypothetical protein [Candidatus Cloacimonas acidaminovorans]HRU82994.1 hypothetical protein [Candidatus Cloacimonas sp.]MDY0217870.1 hypothetical protein [Candidatus Cloacimonas acidaminovorans]HOM79913.1 hypothetical protein [Candidatus Cloacimonas acidaminovorans]HOT39446.1 hypothetical protein [Candidatus Cloacimonas acidaminovorans]
MTTWKISWKPLSSLSTPLQSDTIFGHLCWAVNYLWAEKDKNKLTDFLNALKKTPCLILSSAFPAGSLPKPVIPVKDELLDDLRNILKNELKEITDLEISQVLKDLKKDKWIKRQDLQEGNFVYNIKNDLKSLSLMKGKEILKNRGIRKVYPKNEEEIIEFHNMIDRITGTTIGSGELFASSTVFYNDISFESWLDTDYFGESEIKEIFHFIEQNGFGKDKNTGKGKFEITVEEFHWQDCPQNNAYLNLSNMVPGSTDSTIASYNSKTKFGKVGGDYATSKTPFKYPIYIIEPGAVFFAEGKDKKPVGSLLSNIHPTENIVQNLYSYSIPIMIKGS